MLVCPTDGIGDILELSSVSITWRESIVGIAHQVTEFSQLSADPTVPAPVPDNEAAAVKIDQQRVATWSLRSHDGHALFRMSAVWYFPHQGIYAAPQALQNQTVTNEI